MVNYYQEFNIDPSMNGNQLSDELRKLQRKWIGRTNAPDLNRRQEAERKVALLEEAQRVLLDEAKRKQYDEELNRAQAQPAQDTPTYSPEETYADAATLIQDAWVFINNGQYADAIVVARLATEMEGNNADAWATLGYADYSWNNVQDAIYEYKKAINLMPNNDSYYCDLGDIYLDQGMLNEAEDCANRALHINPEGNYNKLLMGNIASARNDFQKAIPIFTELLEIEPDNESYKKVLANSYYYKGLSYCFNTNDGYFYNIDEEDTKKMIECMEKARIYVDDPEYTSKIKWGEKALKKQFDKSKWTLFIIPAFMLFGQIRLTVILGFLLIVGLGYLCMRPGWRITRNELLGDKTLFDKLALVFVVVFGAIWTFIVEFMKGLFSSNNRR